MGRHFKYTAEQIEQKFIQYNDWMKTQFDCKHDFIKSGERAGEQITIKLPKIKSVEGFCLFADIEMKTFYNYLNEESVNIDPLLIHTITRIRGELMEQRKSLALNGVIHAPFLMALDGIRQVSEVEHKNLPQPVTINIMGESANLKGLFEPFQDAEVIE
jgi:hypothetical protein